MYRIVCFKLPQLFLNKQINTEKKAVWIFNSGLEYSKCLLYFKNKRIGPLFLFLEDFQNYVLFCELKN